MTLRFAAVFVLAAILPAQAADGRGAAIAEASQRFAIPESWIRAVIAVESGGNARIVSPKGAMGLMQIMPATWAVLRPRYALGSDPFDIRDNILAGTALLRELFDRFGAQGFLAAYNGGPARFLAYLAKGQPLAAETRAYLAKIAPLLGDEGLAGAVRAPAGLPDWRSAPLFAQAQEPPANPLWIAAAPGDSAAPPSRLAPASGALFAPSDGAAQP